ncbi:helix-turn-helix domain-containing protein [Actinoplanes sp. DH11]|uniref:helix-turn-helix domain-containing protein n=1 Tax=Actinoplanes sp. DH11 TaxID=2857011 RepID=UPI001E47B06B|nr:helix-turn-helix domain-containing protein [Actinoplanes sp. DH11]
MAEPERKELGNRLARLRKDAGLRQTDIARMINYRNSTVSNLETGKWKVLPDEQVIRAWVDACLELLDATAGERDERRADINSLYTALRTLQHVDTPAPGVPLANQLRRDLPTFTGRAAELDRLRTAVETARSAGTVIAVHAVDGKPGVGKTAFANHAAHRLGRQFPDTRLFIDLHGYTSDRSPLTAGEALEQLLKAVGVPAGAIPATLDERAALWRVRMAGQRALLVLDNAIDAGQVTPLLPNGPHTLVLVTSRRRLVELEAATVALDVLPPDEAAEMFRRVVGRDLPEDSPVDEVVRLCGHLPLAISLAAARIRNRRALSVAELARRLGAEHRRLSELRVRNVEVTAALHLSFDALDAEQRRFFRTLGLHPGADVDGYAAAALCALPVDDGVAHLEGLYGDNLVDEYVYGRFQMHDLVRDYLDELNKEVAENDRERARGALFDYYEQVSWLADRHLTPRRDDPAPPSFFTGSIPPIGDRRQAVTWLSADRANVIACLGVLDDRSPRLVRMTTAISCHLRRTGPWDTVIRLQQRAAEAAAALGETRHAERARLELAIALRNHGDYDAALTVLDDLPSDVDSLLERGTVRMLLGGYDQARADYQAALGLARAAGDEHDVANALLELGTLHYLLDHYDEAVALLSEARTHYERLGDEPGLASVLRNLGNTWYFMDRYAEAIDALERARDLGRELDLPLVEAQATTKLGSVLRLMGRHEDALRRLDEARELTRRLADRSLEAEILIDTGAALRELGHIDESETAFAESIELYDQIGEDLGRACALKEYGDLLVTAQRLDDARSRLVEARDLYRSLKERLGQAAVDNSLGRLESMAGRPGEAVRAHESALAVALEVATPLEEAEARLGTAEALAQLGRTDEARAAAQAARALLLSISAAGVDRADALLHRLGT